MQQQGVQCATGNIRMKLVHQHLFRLAVPVRLLLMAMVASVGAAAAHGAEYTPDVAEFDGTSTLRFDVTPDLFLGAGGSIEFWVVPDWTEAPGYDPVVISNAGPEGASYLVSLLRDRDGLVFISGDAEFFLVFDFTDRRLHHVALVYEENRIAGYVDGRLQGAVEFTVTDLPSMGLWIGSADGSTAPFVGAVAGLRIWGAALTREEIVAFAAEDVLADRRAHPASPYLLAVSDFRNDNLLIMQEEPAPEKEAP